MDDYFDMLAELMNSSSPTRVSLMIDVLRQGLTWTEVQQLKVGPGILDLKAIKEQWSNPWEGHTINSLWYWLIRDNWSSAQRLLIKYKRPNAITHAIQLSDNYRWSDCLEDLMRRSAEVREPQEEYWEYAIERLMRVVRVTSAYNYWVNVIGHRWTIVCSSVATSLPKIITELLSDSRLVLPEEILPQAMCQPNHAISFDNLSLDDIKWKDTNIAQYMSDICRRTWKIPYSWLSLQDFHKDYMKWAKQHEYFPETIYRLVTYLRAYYPDTITRRNIRKGFTLSVLFPHLDLPVMEVRGPVRRPYANVIKDHPYFPWCSATLNAPSRKKWSRLV